MTQQVLTETADVSHFILHHDHHGGIALQWSAHPMAMCWSWMPSVVADSAHVVKSASSTSSQEVMYVQVARTFSWHLNILIHFTGHERRSDIGCLFEIFEYRGATKTFNNFTNWSTEFDRVPQQAQQPDTLSQFSQSNCSQDSGLVPCLDRMFYLVLDVISLSQSESVWVSSRSCLVWVALDHLKLRVLHDLVRICSIGSHGSVYSKILH